MTRPIPFAPTLVLAAAVVVAACGGGSSGPAPDRPDGDRRPPRSPRPSRPRASISTPTLDGTIEHRDARRRRRGGARSSSTGRPLPPTWTSPAAPPRSRSPHRRSFNLTGELIAVDGKAYYKTSLQGPQYEVLTLGGQALPIDPSNTGGMIDAVGDFLLQPGVDPVKGDDVACGSTQCYTVKAELTADELAALGLGGTVPGLPVDISGASLAVTLRVEKDLPHHLAGMTIVVTTGDGNAITLDAILSRWDEPVSITAPPADQIKAG